MKETPSKSVPSALFEPLNAALEGLDPLTQFAKELDPLTKMAVEMVCCCLLLFVQAFYAFLLGRL